jgi:hypothetical protein
VTVKSVLDHHRSRPLQQDAGHRVGITLARYENYGSPHYHSLLKTIFNKP